MNDLRPATRSDHYLGTEWTAEETIADPAGASWTVKPTVVVTNPDVVLFVRTTVSDNHAVVDLVDAAGFLYARQVQAFLVAHPADDDAEEERRLAAEREEAIGWAHKAMLSSYIGKPPPIMRGDAERMVDALIAHGWGPLPAEEPVDYDDWPDPDGED